MVHSTAVLVLNVSEDTRIMASGDKEGTIKIWNPKTGKCIRSFENVHSANSGGVSALDISKNNTQMLSTGLDGRIKVLGLKSGTVLKELGCHDTFIRKVSFLTKDSAVSVSQDAVSKLWKTSEGLDKEFKVLIEKEKEDVNLVCIEQHPEIPDQAIVSASKTFLSLVSLSTGKLLNQYSCKEGRDEVLVQATFSRPDGRFIYATSTAHTLYVFDMVSTSLLQCVKVVTD